MEHRNSAPSIVLALLVLSCVPFPIAYAQDFFELVIPEGITLCEVGKNGPIEIAQETLAQIDFVSGTIQLRTDVETFEAELVEEFRIGSPEGIATATGPGVFTRCAHSSGRFDFSFEQQFLLGESIFDLTFSTNTLQPGAPPIVMDNESQFSGNRFWIVAVKDQTWIMEFAPCDLAGQRFVWDVHLEGDRRLQVNFRTVQRNACGAWVRISSARMDLPDLHQETIEQRDYWKLITWSPCHFFAPSGTWLLFDEPIGEVYGVGIEEETGEYLNQEFERIQTFNVISQDYTFVEGLNINEVMPDNRTTHTDEGGDFDPWIEIFNPHDYLVDLEGIGLTDELENPDRWIFPAGTSIAAGGFVVVWADGEPEEGPLHAAFRLESGSGAIGLFNRTVFGDTEWDAITYAPQEPDRSVGRLPDGTGEFESLAFSSPGSSNESTPIPPTPSPAPTFVNDRSDIDGSGEVDAVDLLLLITDWMKMTDES